MVLRKIFGFLKEGEPAHDVSTPEGAEQERINLVAAVNWQQEMGNLSEKEAREALEAIQKKYPQ